jgi:hypothetical protein
MAYPSDHCPADLARSGIEAPALGSYVDRLGDYMRSHPDVGSAAMFKGLASRAVGSLMGGWK